MWWNCENSWLIYYMSIIIRKNRKHFIPFSALCMAVFVLYTLGRGKTHEEFRQSILNLNSRQYISSWHYWFLPDYKPVMAFLGNRLKLKFFCVFESVDLWFLTPDTHQIHLDGLKTNVCIPLSVDIIGLWWGVGIDAL